MAQKNKKLNMDHTHGTLMETMATMARVISTLNTKRVFKK
jgi:hypothetical protein